MFFFFRSECFGEESLKNLCLEGSWCSGGNPFGSSCETGKARCSRCEIHTMAWPHKGYHCARNMASVEKDEMSREKPSCYIPIYWLVRPGSMNHNIIGQTTKFFFIAQVFKV